MADNKKLKEKALAHWRKMRNHTVQEMKDGVDEEPGSEGCSFCQEYLNKFDDCTECPIYKKTGARYCLDTPYGAAEWAFFDFQNEPNRESKKAWQEAADKQIEFIEGLEV